MSDLWDSVPNIYSDGRSMVPYPDPAPESTARMWAQWREEQAARKALRNVEVDEDAADDVYKNHEPPVITQKAVEFDEPNRALGTYVKDAISGGWTLVELAHAKATARGKVIKSGAKAGQRNTDREIETQWMKVEKVGVGRAVVSYTIFNGKSNSVYRSFNGQVQGDKEMKAILKGES